MTRVGGGVVESSVTFCAIQYFMTFLVVTSKILRAIKTLITIFTIIFFGFFQAFNRDFEDTFGGIWHLIFIRWLIGFCGSIRIVLISWACDWSMKLIRFRIWSNQRNNQVTLERTNLFQLLRDLRGFSPVNTVNNLIGYKPRVYWHPVFYTLCNLHCPFLPFIYCLISFSFVRSCS